MENLGADHKIMISWLYCLKDNDQSEKFTSAETVEATLLNAFWNDHRKKLPHLNRSHDGKNQREINRDISVAGALEEIRKMVRQGKVSRF